MKKKRLLIYTLSLSLITSYINLNKQKSSDLSKNIIEYTKTFSDDDFQIAAHRGFSSKSVENTSEAIQLAANEPYIDYIEIDTRMTKDNVLVLSHNDDIYESTFSKTEISQTNYEDLENNSFNYIVNLKLIDYFKALIDTEKKLDLKRKTLLQNKNYQISTLKESLNLVSNKKVIIDLKFSDNVKEFTEKIMDEFKNINTKNIYFQSSNLLGILYFEQVTNYNCFAIIDSSKDLKYLDLFDNLTIRKNLIDYDTIKYLLDQKKNVAIWTINSSSEIDNIKNCLKELYKDVIYITDYPDLIATTLNDKYKTKIKK